ncbi:TIGR03915 family putative DNA repair protein [Aequorivita sp. F47161]|uniref:TIGR03915 family putative DNA repair protein n=1 Tax=Aequorivita vitellina TaxID=2874475 RepID=A0A9X1QYP9_9FLAO|nr:TIGR03915 family putative DNA repair protein [Aequorivita vitellina]MCG2419518.1 TIGR03915 family putative DNA repair protein [Aequorivita vitellina]MCZ4317437.1 TIGR03915 family putative DNA repair protein [Aequorivita viscosa]
MKTNLIYDGSFEGLLSAVFYVYEYKLDTVSIVKREHAQASFFDTEEEVLTNLEKANRVWKGLSKKISAQGKKKLYKAYLSEITTIENTILYYIRRALNSENNIEKDFTDQQILEISKVSKKVDREKHRMDAFIRFRLTKDEMYFATIEPDFNVLPLNLDHFRKRYADQKWLIYDLKRKYGLYYNLAHVQTVTLNITPTINDETSALAYFSSEELLFQELWGNYFKSSNIASRKNMKLHIKHIPKRYWKYLSEKKF